MRISFGCISKFGFRFRYESNSALDLNSGSRVGPGSNSNLNSDMVSNMASLSDLNPNFDSGLYTDSASGLLWKLVFK